MIKTIKIKQNSHNVFFGGCYHHNHDPKWPTPLWKMRGFNSVEEINEFQIKAWNEICDDNSIVFLLGDTMFGDPKGDKFIEFFRKLKFKTVYIQPGNHLSGYLQNYKSSLRKLHPGAVDGDQINYEVFPLSDVSPNIYGKEIVYIPNYAELSINGTQIVISHYAIRSWNKMSKNSWMLHSHEHLSSNLSDFGNTGNGRIADVGYESLLKYNGGAPISLDKLQKFMDKKTYKPEGHH